MKKRDKELLLLSLAFLFVNMGWGIAWPQLPNYMKALGGSMVMVASLSILFNVFSTLGQYFWGKKSDEMGRRKPFVIFGIATGGFFFFIMAFATTASVLLSMRALQGFFMSAQTPAVSALISELSSNVGRSFGIFNALSNAGFMLGNFIGGFVMKIYPHNYPFLYLLSSIPFIISILLIIFLKEPYKKPADFRMIFRIDRPGPLIIRWKNAIGFIQRNRNITIMTISVLFIMIASGMVYSFLSLLINNRFGEAWVGWYFGLDSGVSIIFVYLLGYAADKMGSKPIIAIGILGYALTFYLYYAATTIYLLLFAALVSGFKWAAYFNSINTYIAKMSFRHERATALGIMNSAMALGWVFGPLIGAYLISLLSLPLTILLAIIPAAVSLVLIVPVENDLNYINGLPKP
ncbi:MAG: MFS transporter [Thermoplasmata archaeon]|nr:MFS transporter [Thermoplasmata archaeon]